MDKSNKLRKNRQSAEAMVGVIFRVYNLRNYLVHGNVDPHSDFLQEELKAAHTFMPAVLALMVQVMLEHQTRKWGALKFGKIDGKPYDSVLKMDC